MHSTTMRFLSALLIAATFLIGCAAQGPTGTWALAPDVEQLFEAGQPLPEHTYYYLGSITAPESIIAISKPYTLRSRVWAEVEMTEQRLQGWLQWFRTEHYGACDYRGGVILTPDGQRAGVWYSQNVFNIVRMPEPGVLEVYQPSSFLGRRCGEQNDAGPLGRW